MLIFTNIILSRYHPRPAGNRPRKFSDEKEYEYCIICKINSNYTDTQSHQWELTGWSLSSECMLGQWCTNDGGIRWLGYYYLRKDDENANDKRYKMIRMNGEIAKWSDIYLHQVKYRKIKRTLPSTIDTRPRHHPQPWAAHRDWQPPAQPNHPEGEEGRYDAVMSILTFFINVIYWVAFLYSHLFS